MAYEINYEDKRFQNVEAQKQEALTKNEQTYAGMIERSDQFYQNQINAVNDYEQKQTQLQQEQTDYSIEQIEQQKDQAKKDYTKEQSGAYTDWQKQSNQYGVNAEQRATGGLTNTGYSESAQVSMYNAYQNRVATARESYQNTVRDYNDAIAQARLQNNAVLAEIAYESLQNRLSYALQGFQYKNQLLLEQANKALEIDKTYYGRYLDVLNQMNTENDLAERVRQYDESMAEEKRQHDQNYELSLQQLAEEQRYHDQNYALQQQQLAEEQRYHDQNYALQQQQLAEKKRQYDQSYALQQQDATKTAKIQKADTTESKESSALVNAALSGASIAETAKGVSNGTGSGSAYVSDGGDMGKLTPMNAKEYGTFQNGYQPKGIYNHGELKKTGSKIPVMKTTSSGEVKTVYQNIWEATDGTQWVWNGVDRVYELFDTQ